MYFYGETFKCSNVQFLTLRRKKGISRVLGIKRGELHLSCVVPPLGFLLSPLLLPFRGAGRGLLVIASFSVRDCVTLDERLRHSRCVIASLSPIFVFLLLQILDDFCLDIHAHAGVDEGAGIAVGIDDERQAILLGDLGQHFVETGMDGNHQGRFSVL